VDPAAGDRDLAALAEVKQGVEAMLEELKKGYEDEWRAKGRDPPDEDEWYDIVDGDDDDGSAETFESSGGATKSSGGLVPLHMRPRKLGQGEIVQQEQWDEEVDGPSDIPETDFSRRMRERAKGADKAAQRLSSSRPSQHRDLIIFGRSGVLGTLHE
jgi:hypothetical protein